MRRIVVIAAAGALAIGGVVGFASTSSATTTDCPSGTVPSPNNGAICIPAMDDGGNDSSGNENGGGWGSSTCSYRGSKTPCMDRDLGTWSQGRQCYLQLLVPQPAPSTEVWSTTGGSPADGRIFVCIKPDVPGNPSYVFVKGGGAPNPADLARKALGQLRLARPEIHLAPEPPHRTYVGVDTWLWMPSGQWATLNKSVSAGATTVTVTAAPDHTVWNMGPASTTCYAAGREWKVGHMPKGSTTSCSYTYTQVSDFEPDKTFTVTATLIYQVDWRCTGTCLANAGTLGQVPGLPGTAQEQVGERQSVLVNGKD